MAGTCRVQALGVDAAIESPPDVAADMPVDQPVEGSPDDGADDTVVDRPDGPPDADLADDGPPDVNQTDGEVGPEVPVDGHRDGEIEMDQGSGDAVGDTTARLCDRTKPFGNIQMIEGIGAAGIVSISSRFSDDELTIYFASDRDGDFDLYTAKRSSIAAPFVGVAKIPDVNSDKWDYGPSLTSNGLTMFFATQRTPRHTLHKTTRTSLDGPWSVPELLLGVSSPGDFPDDGQPYVSPDGNVIYFHSNRLHDEALHIFRTELTADGFSTSEIQIPPAPPFWEAQPVVSVDELELYFGTDRPGDGVKGGWDIWVSHRSSRTEAFGPPVNLQELNSFDDDYPGWMSPDACRLYFERRGSGHFFVASRPVDHGRR